MALSRMVAAGESRPDDDGYRLAGRLLDRQARQTASRRAVTEAWDGTWELAIVRPAGPPGDRGVCATPWRTCGWPSCAKVWLRPANLPPDRSPDARVLAAGQCLSGRHADLTRRPTPALWDLDGWADDARALQAELTELQPRFEAHDTGALGVGFVASAAVLRLLQRDPLLPRALRPASWPGDDLRRAYDRYDAAYRAVWTDWFRRQRWRNHPTTGGPPAGVVRGEAIGSKPRARGNGFRIRNRRLRLGLVELLPRGRRSGAVVGLEAMGSGYGTAASGSGRRNPTPRDGGRPEDRGRAGAGSARLELGQAGLGLGEGGGRLVAPPGPGCGLPPRAGGAGDLEGGRGPLPPGGPPRRRPVGPPARRLRRPRRPPAPRPPPSAAEGLGCVDHGPTGGDQRLRLGPPAAVADRSSRGSFPRRRWSAARPASSCRP